MLTFFWLFILAAGGGLFWAVYFLDCFSAGLSRLLGSLPVRHRGKELTLVMPNFWFLMTRAFRASV